MASFLLTKYLLLVLFTTLISLDFFDLLGTRCKSILISTILTILQIRWTLPCLVLLKYLGFGFPQLLCPPCHSSGGFTRIVPFSGLLMKSLDERVKFNDPLVFWLCMQCCLMNTEFKDECDALSCRVLEIKALAKELDEDD